jgi:biotin synthase-related radical SAM superfamily protein
MRDKYDKTRTFQKAQQGHKQAMDAFESISYTGADYGSELKHVKQEVNEAYEQIQTALSTATEHQREQLVQFEQDLNGIVSDINRN